MTTEVMGHDFLNLHPYAQQSYLDYAVAVVKGRALPLVSDGQKPVQTRILYAMHDIGLTHVVKPRKSAAVVGEVLGKYHPHGDQSVYDAMVRMAQPFTLRYPLIEGQGNFGSRDGDGAAAMRYTEARLSPIAALLLSELGAGTVDFQDNYDGSHKEPMQLPSRLPMLLLNGASGIAVGMACELVSHNLREIAAAVAALIENPGITTSELLDIVPGPDFATGGHITSPREDILSAYETGRGSLRTRAVWKKEELAKGQWQIVITEFPYQVSARVILEQVEVLTNPQPLKGKKALEQQQINLRQASLNLLEKVTDESGKDDPVRLVIVPRSSKQSPEETMAFLFANTRLEDSVPINNTCIGINGQPRTKGLKQMLQEWVEYRRITVRRRTQHELDVVNRRLHILEGREKVYLDVDAVVNTIRLAEDPKTDLMEKYGLSDIQVADILEMRLRQLARLEGFKLDGELADGRKEQARLTALLASTPAMNKLIVKEIAADAEKYGDDRRTLIKAEAKATAARVTVDEPLTIIVSQNLWVRVRQGHEVDEATLTYKMGDSPLAIVKTRSTQTVFFLDSKGRAYSVAASTVPTGRGDGVPLTTLIDVQDGAKVLFCLADSPEQHYLFSGQQGCGYVTQLKSLDSRPKAGKAFQTLLPGEAPMPPVRLPSVTDGFVACGSTEGKMLCFPVSAVKALDKGKGIILMQLDDGQTLSGITYFEDAPFSAKVELNGKTANISFGKADLEKYIGSRARKGALLPKKAVLRG